MTPKMDFYLDKLQFSSSPSAKLETRILQEKEEMLKKHLRNHPGCDELLEKVFESGPVSVEFCDPLEMMSTDYWSPLSRKIRISTAVKDPFPLLEAFILKLCASTIPEIENTVVDLSQTSTLRDYLELYPTAEAFADKQAENAYAARCRTNKIYQSGLENHKWPASRTGVVLRQQPFEEYLSILKSTDELLDGLTRYENFKRQYLEGSLNIIDANKKRTNLQIQQNQKMFLTCTETLNEMKKTIQINREILGIKKEEVVYTESERMFQEFETRVKNLENTLRELKMSVILLEDREKKFNQALEILKVKAIKAAPQVMHTVTKIEIIARMKTWLQNFNKIERTVSGQQRARLNEMFIKIQNLILRLDDLNALKVDVELKTYEDEILKMIEIVRIRNQQSLFRKLLSWLNFDKPKKAKPPAIVFQKKKSGVRS